MHVLYVLCSPLLFASEHFTFPRGTRLPGRSSAPFQAFFHPWGDHLTSLGLGSLSLRAAHAVARRPSTECWFSSRLSQLDAWRLRARTDEAFMMSESNQELCMFRNLRKRCCNLISRLCCTFRQNCCMRLSWEAAPCKPPSQQSRRCSGKREQYRTNMQGFP